MTQYKVYKIEYQSAWVSPQYFETDDMKSAIDICEEGISRQYIVLVNGKRCRSVGSFDKTIHLDN
jgi:CO dehydrogenase/acetyl-CoA synthase alpha subunit